MEPGFLKPGNFKSTGGNVLGWNIILQWSRAS